MSNYHNIPAEMREYKQWLVWKLEETIEGKPTKVPYSALGGYQASVTNPNDWSSFADAVRAKQNNSEYSGIGFVLTADDPYCFVDLDYPKNKSGQEFLDIQQRQQTIYNTLESYTEASPSGQGFHIIIKGSIPSGRKRDSIELYSKERYMTMTGDVRSNRTTINDYSELVMSLWQMMGKHVEHLMHTGNEPMKEDDNTVIARALSAVNSQKFSDLGDGNWMHYGYPSQSEADFALIDIIAFYTKNREQIARIFRMSALGRRAKYAQGKNYHINRMISMSFDNMLPPIDIDGLNNAINETLATIKGEQYATAKKADNVVVTDDGNNFELPPGLLGAIAKYIYDSAPTPVPEIALAGAIGFMAGIAGRSYNVSATGLNNYVLLLAGTGRGKEAIANGINKLTHAVAQTLPNIRDHIGPGEIASPQGLIKWLDSHPCFVGIIGEFGEHLEDMTSRNPNPAKSGIRRAWLDLYSKSGKGQSFNGSAYSQSERNVKVIASPSYSFIGESNPNSFYFNIDERSVANGLLPRLTVIEYNGLVPAYNHNHAFCEPSEALKQSLSQLVASCQLMATNNSVIDVEFNDEAKELSMSLREECVRNINTEQSGVLSELYNRVHLRTLKLAALYAVGVNQHMPVIDATAFNWAKKIVITGVLKMIARFNSGMVGANNHEAKQYMEMVRVIKEYYIKGPAYAAKYKVPTNLYEAKGITYKYLWDRLHTLTCYSGDKQNVEAAIKRSIRVMMEAGVIVDATAEMRVKQNGANAKIFMLVDTSILEDKAA